MNRFEEYLNGLDRKNLIMLYLSVVIVAFVVYYNFNYSVLSAKIEENGIKIAKLEKKAKKTHGLNKKLVLLKNEYKKLKKIRLSLNEDLKYLNVLINTSEILKLSDAKILKILRDILQSAIDYNIVASYNMSFQSNDYNTYIVNVSGDFGTENFRNFFNFIKSIESMKSIKEIKVLNFQKTKNVQFDMQIYFWGLK